MPVVNSWALSLVASLIYLGLFFHVSKSNDPQSELLFGFCVSGAPLTPNRLDGCHRDNRNSHMASFVLDSAMGLAVYILYCRLQKNANGVINPKITLQFECMASIILFHGFLHFVLSEVFNCYILPENIPTWLKMAGFFTVGVFSFVLCFVILGMSFARDGNGLIFVTIASLMSSAIVLFLIVESGLEWILPALFSVSHPLSCIAALFSKSPLFTQAMGWTFLLASCMGILELTQCATLYRNLGGHVLYDFWLHVTVLLCLPPFAPALTSLTVKEG